MKNDIIKAVNIVGDYFLTGDMDSMLIAPLIGTRLTAEELTAALPRNTEDVVMNLSREELVKLLMSK